MGVWPGFPHGGETFVVNFATTSLLLAKTTTEAIRSKFRRVIMDLRVLLTTFGIIFLAEMGDKTQLAAMTLAAQTKKPWAVFVGASLALVAVSGLGVLVGSVIGDYVPLIWVKRVAATAFIVIGVLMLMGKF
jgi:putative Ca2+/H+ antiporter (TMEM165/GDT1 family)